jgi:hypothetical protein
MTSGSAVEKEKDQIAFFSFHSEVFSVNAGDLFYFADLKGSSVIFVPPPFGINASF